MSSPAPSDTSQAPAKGPQEQITFRFCRECSNMLYPKEDKQTTKLMFACRTCQYSEEAQSSCVFRNNMYNTVGETAGVTQDVGSDPTVGDPDFPSDYSCCTLCGKKIEDEDGYDEDEDEDMDMDEEQVDSGDEAYLSETKYDSDGEVKPKAVAVRAGERGGLSLAEMSQMEEDEENREGGDGEEDS